MATSSSRAASRPAGRPAQDAAAKDSALDRRYRHATERVRSTSAGRVGLQAVVFVIGLLFVASGVALAVLPGPLTIPPVLVGVYVWSLEFAWARRLRVRVNKSAREAWRNAKQHPARAILITVLGLVAAAVAVWAVTHYQLVDRLKDAIS